MRTRKALIAVACSVALTGCGAGDARPAAPPTPLEGLLTRVTATTVTVRTETGQTFTFVNADTIVGRRHLEEHLEKKEPVKITHETIGGRLVARRIEDA